MDRLLSAALLSSLVSVTLTLCCPRTECGLSGAANNAAFAFTRPLHRIPTHHRSHSQPAWRASLVDPQPGRRRLLQLAGAALLAPSQTSALSLPGLGFPAGGASWQLVSSPKICSSKVRVGDFVVITYTGRFTDGAVIDDRYAERPLIYELGSFYIPGVDAALIKKCVNSEVQVRWKSSPELGTPEMREAIPAGSDITYDITLKKIRYDLYGRKMQGYQVFFVPPLSLTSAPEFNKAHTNGQAGIVDPDIRNEDYFGLLRLGYTTDGL